MFHDRINLGFGISRMVYRTPMQYAGSLGSVSEQHVLRV
jgi:hypothetical protein